MDHGGQATARPGGELNAQVAQAEQSLLTAVQRPHGRCCSDRVPYPHRRIRMHHRRGLHHRHRRDLTVQMTRGHGDLRCATCSQDEQRVEKDLTDGNSNRKAHSRQLASRQERADQYRKNPRYDDADRGWHRSTAGNVRQQGDERGYRCRHCATGKPGCSRRVHASILSAPRSIWRTRGFPFGCFPDSSARLIRWPLWGTHQRGQAALDPGTAAALTKSRSARPRTTITVVADRARHQERGRRQRGRWYASTRTLQPLAP